ncbi:hypothetical protein QBC40DRAFT_5003 [Triangularia verruculosa]|uniref:ABM domain-containing protein n=1 Tax=Triangularia verruculosa TaxID=2587418 RepID=A0AAN6XC88_9PEZI|nr:hypothetical protein QBC40DRAFT_5003 [Triangularia verruculosa]
MPALHFLAILCPKPDRVARVEKIAESVCDYVEENEPGVLQYQWFRAGTADEPKIVVWEIYTDQAAVDAHKSSSKLVWLIETEEEESNMREPIQVLPLEPFAGWTTRT